MRSFLRFFIIAVLILNCSLFTSCSKKLTYDVLDEERYLNPVFDKVDVERNIPYKALTDPEAVGQNILDIYQPHGDDEKARKVIVLVHGGGFTSGDKNEMSDLANKLALRGYVCLSVNYTLGRRESYYDDVIMTVTTSDIVAAVNWLKHNSGKYKVDMDQIAIGGVSAGGYISVDTAFSKCLYSTGPKFFAVIDMFGGMRAQSPSEESPPVLMIHGDKDDTVPISESYNLKSALDNVGVYNELFVMKGAGHGITAKYSDEVLLRISKFLYKMSQMELNPLFEAAKSEVGVIPGESTVIELKTRRSVDVNKVKVHMPKSCKIYGFKRKTDKNLSFKLEVPKSVNIKGDHILTLEPAAGNGVYGKTLITLKILEPVEITLGSTPDGNSKDGMKKFFIMKNKYKNKTVSGYINVRGSGGRVQKFSFKSLKPGKEKEFRLDDETFGYCSFNMQLENGLRRTYTKGVFITTAHKTNKPPKIDGSLDEWKNKPSFVLNDKRQVKLIEDWKGPKDLSCVVSLMWDDKNFYLAVVVNDDVNSEKYQAGDIWNGDSIQFAFDSVRKANQGTAGMDEFGLALDESGQIYNWRWIASDDKSVGSVGTIKSSIKKGKDNVVYEAAIPWKEILHKGMKPASKELLGFSLMANDNDGAERRGWIEFGSGIGSEKDSALYGGLYLMN